ncbi:MAG TPA: hypothetical protein PLU16_12985 [Gallionellaceae bacterium]|nr:hypothetical protein [Gallionellaceae bacterium]HQS76123.1 hypothetical protein [Gallionellaceae bacterium]
MPKSENQKLIQKPSSSVGFAHTICFSVLILLVTLISTLTYLPPVHRLNFSSASGAVRRGLFEHVAAQQIVRVPQPRLLMKN